MDTVTLEVELLVPEDWDYERCESEVEAVLNRHLPSEASLEHVRFVDEG